MSITTIQNLSNIVRYIDIFNNDNDFLDNYCVMINYCCEKEISQGNKDTF